MIWLQPQPLLCWLHRGPGTPDGGECHHCHGKHAVARALWPCYQNATRRPCMLSSQTTDATRCCRISPNTGMSTTRYPPHPHPHPHPHPPCQQPPQSGWQLGSGATGPVVLGRGEAKSSVAGGRRQRAAAPPSWACVGDRASVVQ